MTEHRPEQVAYILEMLQFIDRNDLHFTIWWRCGERLDDVEFQAHCNDLFAWGMSDAHPIPPQNVPAFKQAVADCTAIDRGAEDDGALLYVCRERGMRPQGAAYPRNQALWPLFDACGPEREVGPGNPHPHPSHSKQSA